ncbi:MAG: hypothetical protein HY882_15390 [Deltaproteobacteria bacterium]|nr:hypothetical protein [Deltaproteobacteria bacterium]
MEKVLKSLMAGAVDLHLHATFEGRPRRQNMLEVARDASAAGMRGLVFKSNDESTVGSANLVNSLVEGVQTFGGIVLNHAVGGLNIHAAKAALSMGGKIVWMPCFDSAWTLKKVMEEEAGGGAKIYRKLIDPNGKGAGISILKGGLNGSEVLPEVREIIALVAAKGAILDTSHLSPRESLILVREARKAGLERILISHVNSDLIAATVEEQKELARAGAFLMYTFAQCLPSPWRDSQPLQTVISMIKEVGPEHGVLATDLGMFNYPPPVEGLRMFLAGLFMGGIKEGDLERMVKINPAFLLNL